MEGSSVFAVKYLRAATLFVLAVFVLVPIFATNHEKDVVSDIDNRKLTELPTIDKLESSSLESYFSDRIGFRKEMIGAYSLANDKLFGIMVHPTYEYGEDGYTFFRFSDKKYDEGFIWAYASYVAQMQEYCEARGVPFLYVISPEKKRTYSDKMAASVNWQADSSAILRPMLDELNVNYIDLNDALLQARDEGIDVFNVVYDAGHWNTEGMYAGVRYIIDALNRMGVSVSEINLNDYERAYTEQTSLPASFYPIHEMTYKYQRIADGTESKAMKGYGDAVEINEHHKTLRCYENESLAGGVDLLMFQGSYFNSQGTMLQNQFAHTFLVHDYENVLSLPYYVDVFDPDVVIFECADYTLLPQYYNYDKLRAIELPPSFDEWSDLPIIDCVYEGDRLMLDANLVVNNFSVDLPGEYCSAYVRVGDRVLDTVPDEAGAAHWGIRTSELVGLNSVDAYCINNEGTAIAHYVIPVSD